MNNLTRHVPSDKTFLSEQAFWLRVERKQRPQKNNEDRDRAKRDQKAYSLYMYIDIVRIFLKWM